MFGDRRLTIFFFLLLVLFPVRDMRRLATIAKPHIGAALFTRRDDRRPWRQSRERRRSRRARWSSRRSPQRSFRACPAAASATRRASALSVRTEIVQTTGNRAKSKYWSEFQPQKSVNFRGTCSNNRAHPRMRLNSFHGARKTSSAHAKGYLPTPLPGSAISKSMCAWIGLICSA